MSSSRTRKRRTGLALAATLPMVAGALAMGIPTVAHADAAASSRDALTGTKPAWATAKADKGATADSSKVTARVYFAGRDADGLAAYAKAVSDPSSALYGKYLTAKQANARFGTTTAQVAEVKSWLKSSGLKVTGTTARYVTVTGDVAAAEKAFSTQLHNYTKSGKTYRAPSKTASAPAGPERRGPHRHRSGQRPAPGQAQRDAARAERGLQELRAVLLVLRLQGGQRPPVRVRLQAALRGQGLHRHPAARRLRREVGQHRQGRHRRHHRRLRLAVHHQGREDLRVQER